MTRCIGLCCIGSRRTIEQLDCEPLTITRSLVSPYPVKDAGAIVAEGNGYIVKPGIVQAGFAQGNVNHFRTPGAGFRAEQPDAHLVGGQGSVANGNG